MSNVIMKDLPPSCFLTPSLPSCVRRLGYAMSLLLALGSLAASAMAMAATPLKLDLNVTVDDRKVSLLGVTNLPDSTELIVSVFRKESRFSADDKTKVSDGKFRAGPFSDKQGPLSPGRYMVVVTAPIAAVQPRSVQAILGNNYSNFTSPLVKKSEFGTVIRRETSAIIVGEVDKKADANANRASLEEGWQSRRSNCKTTPDMAHRPKAAVRLLPKGVARRRPSCAILRAAC